MPPKRRGAQAKLATPATKPTQPDPPKPAKSVPAPCPPLPTPPPPPLETDATKVRKEWSKFMDAWYEPQKKKLVEKLQKDLLVKYKNLGSPKETHKLREMELFEKLDSLAQQLAQPARTEWERRLMLAQLREDQWDDMTGEEQQAVMSVFIGFVDDVEDLDDGDFSAEPSSIEEDSVTEEPPYRVIPSYPPPVPSVPSKQPIPPTPTRQTFEFVNPTSFFTDSMTPPNPTKNLPALSMDHLATLGPSNAGRSAEPISASVSGVLGFQNWASEAGIATQLQLQPQPAKLPSASTSSQTLSARLRAADMSRQTSLASSSSSSPPLKSTSPPFSSPNLTTKFSLPTNTENLPLGKRYIGPVILEEEPDPMDAELLKSKMAEEYQQYKVGLRIHMIQQFHVEAAEVEIKLFEMLLADKGTKESRARAVQEHETNMMRLREQKEEERKRLCAEERERRRQEIRHLTQRRSTPNREIDSGPKANPSKPIPDKTSAQQRPSKVTHQKENLPLTQSVPPSSSKLEPPSLIKKSNSTLSQDEASANEAVFANAMATMMRGETGAAVLTSAQASLNEALFSNAAAKLTAQGQPASSGKNTVQPPSIMKKSNSSRSQECNVPQITVSFAEPPVSIVPEPAQVPPATAKGKKGKKGQLAMQVPPTKQVAFTEQLGLDTHAELPPLAPSLWVAATAVAKNVWGAASSPSDPIAAKPSVSVEEVREPEPTPTIAPAPSKGSVSAKKTVSAAKKGKKVTITEEPDVDADPIVSPPPSAKTNTTKGAWGSVNKSKVAPLVVEESEAELPTPPHPASSKPARGKKGPEAATKPAQKPHLKVTIAEESESEFERVSVPTWTAPSSVPSASTSTQAGKKATQQQAVPRHGGTGSGSKFVRVDVTPDPEDQWRETAVASGSTMPGTLKHVGPEQAEEDEEGDASAWFNPENMSYWANFMAGPPEAETQTQTQTQAQPLTVPQATEQTGKHVLWMPTVSGESDDEEGFGDADAELATSMWMQYAISGGDIPGLNGTPEEPHVMPSEIAQRNNTTNIWEPGRGKKKSNPTAGDVGNRAQQTPIFDRAALTAQWPKMESWLSPPSRGQSSGSTRVF